MSENLSKNDRFFGRICGIFRIFPDFISCSNFYLKKINFFILYFLFHFLFLFFDFSAKFREKIVPIFEISQGQCPRTGIFLLLH